MGVLNSVGLIWTIQRFVQEPNEKTNFRSSTLLASL